MTARNFRRRARPLATVEVALADADPVAVTELLVEAHARAVHR